MKKRLISLLVALCMAVTLLPVSAITAWAEEGGSPLKPLRFRQGLPVLDDITPTTDSQNHQIYTGDGWSYDATAKVLTIAPESPTTYDLTSIRHDPSSILCSAIIGENATIVNGNFLDIDNPGPSITNHGTITSGAYSMPVINHGTITGGTFFDPITNDPTGTIENGTFSSTVTNNGTIKGGIFRKKPEDGQVADGYTLKVNSQKNVNYEIRYATIKDLGSSGYVIPNSDHDTSVTIKYTFSRSSPNRVFSIDVTFGDTNDTPCLLEDWAPSAGYSDKGDNVYVTFTAPHAHAGTVTLSILTRLVIDENGYPVGTKGGTQDYSGNGWKFEKSNSTLTLTNGSYDFSGEKNALRPLNPNVHLMVESGATLTGGAFAKEPKGAGTFKTVTLNGTDSITAVNGLASGDWGNTLYVVKTGNNTITASKPILDINRILFENDDSLYPNPSNKKTVCINIESLNSVNALDSKADIILNQASHGLSLIMDNDGTPVIVNAPFEPAGGYYTYYGDGWHIQKPFEGIGTLYLTGGNTYNFRYTDPVHKTGQLDAVKCGIINEGSTIEDGVFNTLAANGLPYSTSSTTPIIKGGTFAAGLYCNNGEITGGAFNGKDDSFLTHETVLSGNYRSVTVNGGAIVKVNDTRPLVPGETGYDLVQGSAWDLYSYAGTVLTVESNVDITNINGQEIGDAFSSYYLNGETNKKVVRFEMPDSDVELNSTKIVVPDPKPEPKPEPEPEAPTYTLTVKGGTFTYNGGEAMTSASVPVDAEVKVTLNQSAVPEGMVFDLWAMDEASLLGNPAVAYNEESFTIPAGTVAKDSTVTVEAQYRDATIESEPSILGTAAIIGVAGAGTAVIVWQGYRIGMELYEKYFQPTPEEDAVVEPTLESQMTDPIS
ncbi:hypothetical protein [Faecalibacterium prausnitzii]|uniref:hypothetical protein n=1 Tax=Faecalibacterium prausnitzii TaxID=853 RepID=UPI0011C18CA5|nr:hypothetical protein [Faecalibacterium prausnitzii]